MANMASFGLNETLTTVAGTVSDGIDWTSWTSKTEELGSYGLFKVALYLHLIWFAAKIEELESEVLPSQSWFSLSLRMTHGYEDLPNTIIHEGGRDDPRDHRRSIVIMLLTFALIGYEFTQLLPFPGKVLLLLAIIWFVPKVRGIEIHKEFETGGDFSMWIDIVGHPDFVHGEDEHIVEFNPWMYVYYNKSRLPDDNVNLNWRIIVR